MNISNKSINIELTENEYDALNQAIKLCIEKELFLDNYNKFLNRIILKLMKAKYPELCRNIGPW